MFGSLEAYFLITVLGYCYLEVISVLLLDSRKNAMRLQEKERIEREQLQQIIDDADDYKDNHKAKRVTNRDAQMKNNRDKERVSVLS